VKLGWNKLATNTPLRGQGVSKCDNILLPILKYVKLLKLITMKRFIFVIAILFSVAVLSAQETVKKSKKELKAEKKAQQIADTKVIVESKNFVFDARTANPMKGSSRTLTSEYDVTLKNDSVYCYLPYFGVAYSADYGSNQGPLTFDQPVKTYKMEPDKKGYVVEVKANNKSDDIEFTFHISETGSTSLTVLSTNRQSITFYGEIQKIEEKKK
jgi:hypothetical protein